MGGYHSGTWERWGARPLVEETRSLDVRELHRLGYLRRDAFTTYVQRWCRGDRETAAINVTATYAAVVLRFRYRQGAADPWQDVRQAIPLEWTACPFGGERPWFRCTGCDRRAALVYDVGRDFLCRRCGDLRYRCQRASTGDLARERARAIRMRLGGGASMLDPFPPRPKGMHRRTYDRLRRRCRAYEAVSDAALAVWLDQQEQWLGTRFGVRAG